MNVGTARTEITPPASMMPLDLSGFVAREQPALGVRDPLFARGLYLESGAERLLWIHADVLGFSDSFADDYRAWAARRLGIGARQIVLSASHTHHAPATIGLSQCGEVRRAYVEFLGRQLRATAMEAAGRRRPATPHAARVRCELAVDRRGGPSAHTDPHLSVVAWLADGACLAVLCNYAMHNVALGSRNRLVSGDTTGLAAAALEALLPGRPTVLFTIAGAGNVNPPATDVAADQVEAWARRLADAAAGALRDARPLEDVLASRFQVVPFELDRFDGPRIARHLADHLPAGEPDDDTPVRRRIRRAMETWRDEMTDLARRGRAPSRGSARLGVVRIGEVCFACVNAEPFSRLADDLRAKVARRDVYVVGYANGLFGYLPTAEAYDEGGYETDLAFVFYNSFRPKRGTFEMIGDRLAESIQRALSGESRPARGD